jgi:protein O-GlcNAc transferase
MSILDRTPNSVLWLLKRDSAIELNLNSTAKKLGIDPDRLVFTRPIEKCQHLSRLSLADLCLDTRVVNGAATTSDALWAGIPVVTIEGHHFASKMSASILTAAGLPELVTHDLKQYEDLAVALATYPEKMNAVRDKLSKNQPICPLFDTRKFVRNLESVFEQMWESYVTGEKPKHIFSKFRTVPVSSNSINRASIKERMTNDDSV